jgi:hypothetical protein
VGAPTGAPFFVSLTAKKKGDDELAGRLYPSKPVWQRSDIPGKYFVIHINLLTASERLR